jgi:hypothetical protein
MNDHPLPALRNQLLRLHKLLMDAERAAYEKEGNVIQSPMQLLQLLIDEAMEEKPPITKERMDALVGEARHLLMGSQEPGSFAVRYAEVRDRDSTVAAAHAEISKSFE